MKAAFSSNGLKSEQVGTFVLIALLLSILVFLPSHVMADVDSGFEKNSCDVDADPFGGEAEKNSCDVSDGPSEFGGKSEKECNPTGKERDFSFKEPMFITREIEQGKNSTPNSSAYQKAVEKLQGLTQYEVTPGVTIGVIEEIKGIGIRFGGKVKQSPRNKTRYTVTTPAKQRWTTPRKR